MLINRARLESVIECFNGVLSDSAAACEAVKAVAYAGLLAAAEGQDVLSEDELEVLVDAFLELDPTQEKSGELSLARLQIAAAHAYRKDPEVCFEEFLDNFEPALCLLEYLLCAYRAQQYVERRFEMESQFEVAVLFATRCSQLEEFVDKIRRELPEVWLFIQDAVGQSIFRWPNLLAELEIVSEVQYHNLVQTKTFEVTPKQQDSLPEWLLALNTERADQFVQE